LAATGRVAAALTIEDMDEQQLRQEIDRWADD